MDLKSSIKKLGITNVLESLFKGLKGVDYENISLIKSTAKYVDGKTLMSYSNLGWQFFAESNPVLFFSTNVLDTDSELKNLLLSNNISFDNFHMSNENLITNWNGNGFVIQNFKIENLDIILILLDENAIGAVSNIFQETSFAKQTGIPNWINGISPIYDSKTVSSKKRNLSNFQKICLLFNNPNSDYILIPEKSYKIAKTIIDTIIENNGTISSFISIDVDSSEWKVLYSGPLFLIGYIEKIKAIRINKIHSQNIDDKEENFKSGIHPITFKIQKSLKGFDKLVYYPNSEENKDGRFIYNNQNLCLNSIDNKPLESINFLKKIVVNYNTSDPFLKIKDESIMDWILNNPNENIQFNIPGKFKIKLSSTDNFLNTDIYPAIEKDESWEDISEEDYIGKPPFIQFSKTLKTQTVVNKEKQKTKSSDFKDGQSQKKDTKEREFLLSSIQNIPLEQNQVKTSKSNNLLRWFFAIVFLILLFLLFRSCDFINRDKEFYYNQGVKYSKEGNFEKAVDNFEKAIELDNYYLEPLVKRGEVYLDFGYPNEAKYDLDQAITNDPLNWYAYYLRGRANMDLGKSKYSRSLKNAVFDFTKSIELNGNNENANSFLFRGKALRLQGNDEACDDFYMACQFDIEEGCSIYNEECYPKTSFNPYQRNFGPGVFTGDISFSIENLKGKKDKVISFINQNSNRRIRSLFVRSGDNVLVKNLPRGNYILQIYSGLQWSKSMTMSDNITKGGFKKDSEFTVILERWPLFNSSQEYGIIFGEQGDLESDTISEQEFFN